MVSSRRISKDEYFLEIANSVSKRSPCIRKFGAIIVKDGSILSTGYNGSVRGALNCGLDIECLKAIKGEHRGSYQFCPAVHAEANAIINLARNGGSSCVNATMYIFGDREIGSRPCIYCKRMILQSGIREVIYRNENGEIVVEDPLDWIKEDNKWMFNILEGK